MEKPFKIIVVFFFSLTTMYGQASKQQLINFLGQVSQSMVLQEDDKYLSIDYTQIIYPKAKEEEKQTVRVKIRRQQEAFSFESAYIDCYVDSKESYVVYKSPQKIFQSKSGTHSIAKEALASANILEQLNEIWGDAVVTELVSNRPDIRIISINLTEGQQYIQKIKTIVFEANTKTLKVEGISTFFTEDFFQEKIEYRYTLLDKKNPVTLSNAKDSVFDSSGTLLKKYKGYTIQEIK